ncbi:MAG: hypothetical protein K6E83_03645 [Clostridium sp.]|nr:hypothetical protein [Clostridium sp.]
MTDNVIREIYEADSPAVKNPALLAEFLSALLPGELLDQKLHLLAEEHLYYTIKYEKDRDPDEYAEKLADLSGCTGRRAKEIVSQWTEAVPYEELVMGSMSIGDYRGAYDFDDYKCVRNGKEICRSLKSLRKKIADANGIALEMEECPHQGPCPGTCPRCDDELSALNRELERKHSRGEKLHLEGFWEEEEESDVSHHKDMPAAD